MGRHGASGCAILTVMMPKTIFANCKRAVLRECPHEYSAVASCTIALRSAVRTDTVDACATVAAFLSGLLANRRLKHALIGE